MTTVEHTNSVEGVEGAEKRWIAIHGPYYILKRLRKHLDDYYLVTSNETYWVLVDDAQRDELAFTVANYDRLTAQPSGRPPKNVAVPCGVHVLYPARFRHPSQCDRCRVLVGKAPRIGRNGEVKNVLTAPSLHGDVSLDGLIAAMEVAKDEAFKLAADYEMVIAAVREQTTLDAQLKDLQEKQTEHRAALAFFMQEA